MSWKDHSSDEQLIALLHSDEYSADHADTTGHVETCEICRNRLTKLSGDEQFEQESRQFLHDYPWDQLRASRELSQHSKTAEPHHPQSLDLDFLSTPSHPELLGRLGRYDLERVIGHGGMGIVFKGFDSELSRPVAVKVLSKQLASNGSARRRFARESRAAAAIVHEHVVAIHNIEAEGEVPFIVMQFVAGESLQARIDREGPPDVPTLLRIGIQIAGGLAAAHEQSVIHRDVKPANIMLENGVDRVLLTDFGLARTVDDASLTQTGVIAGTPDYMSPEQANGLPVNDRTDLFSLGSVLYFMATGHPPFRAERAMGVLNRICHHHPKPLWQVASEVPDELSVLVDRLLEKQASKRPSSASDVREQLIEMLARGQNTRSGWIHRIRRFAIRDPRRAATIAILAVVGGLAMTLAVLWPTTEPKGDTFETGRHSQQSATSTAEPPDRRAATFSMDEATEFDRTISQFRRRLETINQSEMLPADRATKSNKATEMQSLHQRLERLQNLDSVESQPEGKNRP